MQETTLHGYRYLAKGGISTLIWFCFLITFQKANQVHVSVLKTPSFRSLILLATTSGSVYAFYFHVRKK